MLNTVKTIELDSKLNQFKIQDLHEGVYKIVTDTKTIVLEVLQIDIALKTMTVRYNHTKYDFAFKDDLDLVLDKMGIKRSVDTINTDVKAPMPGKVIQILVKEGDSIEKGNGILILEAMKMENVLKAESDCVIKKILVKTGESVEKNQILIELDA